MGRENEGTRRRKNRESWEALLTAAVMISVVKL